MATSDLNPEYTFQTFSIGSSNRFAHAAAVAVAEAPGAAYNPLVIYGDEGNVRTHLLHAIGNYARTLYPGMRVRYVTAEDFTSDVIGMRGDGTQDEFRRGYRTVEILLVDDIQFLANTQGVQEEFLRTFDTLREVGRQIVISADRAPRRLVNLKEEIRERLESGLITDIQPPELETRIAILRRRAMQEGLDVPPETIDHIASRITNTAELDVALACLSAFANVDR